jgi:hypothetical protein
MWASLLRNEPFGCLQETPENRQALHLLNVNMGDAWAVFVRQSAARLAAEKGESMTISRHVEEAAGKLQEAGRQIALAREGPATCDNLKVWLEALTVYCEALADIQTYGNESIHEKLHTLAGQMGLRKFPSTH